MGSSGKGLIILYQLESFLLFLASLLISLYVLSFSLCPFHAFSLPPRSLALSLTSLSPSCSNFLITKGVFVHLFDLYKLHV